MFYIDVITIFPDLFNDFLNTGIVKQSQLKNKVSFTIHNLRDFTTDKFRTVDDKSYGGGPGMVLKPEPIFRAVDYIKKNSSLKKFNVVFLSPRGSRFDHKMALSMARKKNEHLIFICGRYEGVDERVMKIVDTELSIGDYVLSGGEIPAMVVTEAVTRLLPGVISSKESYENDSFYTGHLDYPHYTRPKKYKSMKVPNVLMKGNHKDIFAWRKAQSIKETRAKRPDLLVKTKKRGEK